LQYKIVQDGFRAEYRIVTVAIYPLVYIPKLEVVPKLYDFEFL
jgi:hypothetical protein